jgi:hypothetical protein
MAINYKDNRRKQSDRTGTAPLLALIAAVGGLLWLSPQVTDVFTGTVATMLRLPSF